MKHENEIKASMESMKIEFVSVKQDFAAIKEEVVSLGTTVNKVVEREREGKDTSSTFLTSVIDGFPEGPGSSVVHSGASGLGKSTILRPASGTHLSPLSVDASSPMKSKKKVLSPNRTTEGKLFPDVTLPRVAHINERTHKEERMVKLQLQVGGRR